MFERRGQTRITYYNYYYHFSPPSPLFLTPSSLKSRCRPHHLNYYYCYSPVSVTDLCWCSSRATSGLLEEDELPHRAAGDEDYVGSASAAATEAALLFLMSEQQQDEKVQSGTVGAASASQRRRMANRLV